MLPLWVQRLLVCFGGGVVLSEFGWEEFGDVSSELFVSSCGVRGLGPWIGNQFFKGSESVSVVGDNLAPPFSLPGFCAYRGKLMKKFLRCLINWWWSLRLAVQLFWVSNSLNPADGLSRCHHPSFRHRALEEGVQKFDAVALNFPLFRFMGSVFV